MKKIFGEIKESFKAIVKVMKIALIMFVIWGIWYQIDTNMKNGAENIFTAFMGDGDPSRKVVVDETYYDTDIINDESIDNKVESESMEDNDDYSSIIHTEEELSNRMRDRVLENAEQSALILEYTCNNYFNNSLQYNERIIFDIMHITNDNSVVQYAMCIQNLDTDENRLVLNIEMDVNSDELEFYSEGEYIGNAIELISMIQNMDISSY